MLLYKKYFIKKITNYFLVILATLVLLIWFAKAISFIKFITEKGVEFTDFLSLFMLILPWLLLIIIPIALFVAILVAYDQLTNNNEKVILQNAGLDKFAIAKPAIFVAFLCCIACYLISFLLMPMANKKLREVKVDFRNNYTNLLISSGIFENLNNLTIYAKDRSLDDKIFGILIYDNRSPQYSTTITSESGELSKDGNNVLLYLNRGTVQRFNNETRKTDILRFDSYVINLNDKNQVKPNTKWKSRERYVGELLYPEEETTPIEFQKYRAEFHKRITQPLLSLVITIITTAIILSGKFSRYGNLRNNLLSIIFATICIAGIMILYDMIEKYQYLVPIIYLYLVGIIVSGLMILKSTKRI